jgi:hypothetical protein
MDETMSELFLVFVYGLLVILPLWQIVGKAGFHPALSILICVPVVNVVMIYVFASIEWPSVKRER